MIVYNEIDPFAAAWLRELVKANLIAPGEVWENDIRDIRPADLRGVIQFHGFAGIGVWSYAARRAGWPDTRPLWTMSCPCQPFSAAGTGAGFADERHLWPHAHYLVSQCRPAVVVGEQVASKDADAWIDLVQDDMEAMDYAFGAVPFPSASVGAPHIRDRDYWMAYANEPGPLSGSHAGIHRGEDGAGPWHGEPERSGATGLLADADDERLEGWQAERQRSAERPVGSGSLVGGLADTNELNGDSSRFGSSLDSGEQLGSSNLSGSNAEILRPGPVNGFWRDADWLHCRDGKWRPVRCGTFPLAHGAAARVGRLRGYGNAINAVQAQIFIETVIETIFEEIDN